jgi:uncharacterized protein YxjI
MKFYIKQKVFSLGDKFSVLDEQQNEVFQVKGKIFSLANNIDFFDMQGNIILQASKKVFQLLPKYTITNIEGYPLVTVQRRFSLMPRFDVLKGSEELTIEGSLFAHSFQVLRNGEVIASISKQIFSFGDFYEIELHVSNEVELYLFIVIVIDQVVHENKNRGNRY